MLLYETMQALLRAASSPRLEEGSAAAALATVLLFSLHPLRVEVVAW